MVHNDVVQNTTLSFKAKGFLCYILSLPDDWILHKSHVMKEFNIGRVALDNIFKELESAGYLVITDMITDESGRFTGKNYLFYDEPLAIRGFDTDVGFPTTDNPTTDNQHLQSTNNNKVLTNTKDIVDSDFEETWTLYPNKTNKQQSKKYYNAKTSPRTEIRRAVEAYAEKVKKGEIDKKYVMGGRSFFKDERWREYLPTKEEEESVKIPQIDGVSGISSSRLSELWELSKRNQSQFKVFVMAEQIGTRR